MNQTVFCTILMAGVFFLGSCASLPETIAPADMETAPYTARSCEQLSQEDAQLTAALAGASDAQRRCRNEDIAGLLLVGLPVGSLAGCRRTAEIAGLKGKLLAVQHAAEEIQCSLVPTAAEALRAGSMPHEEM